MNNKEVIELKDISKVFRVKTQKILVLKDIDLKIEKGDFAIVFGPSGCGKSTLLHIAIGLEPPTTGIVKFFGINFNQCSYDQISEFRKKNIGIIYQVANWIRSLSVIDNVAFPLSLLGIDKTTALNKATEMLDLVGMTNWKDHIPTELSAGQQQKVALARALIIDPKVIIADEPTGNLDFRSGNELMNLFRKLNKQGKTIVMITHGFSHLDYANKIIQMFDGQIVKVVDISKMSQKAIKTLLTKEVNIAPLDKKIKRVKSEIEESLRTERLKEQKLDSSRILKIKKKLNWLRVDRHIGKLFAIISSLFILVLFLLYKFSLFVIKFRLLPQRIRNISKSIIDKVFSVLSGLFERRDKSSIKYIDLIDISVKNLLAKKTRTAITIGGMAIGIGFIVFLISVGYGLEKLVIDRVAKLSQKKLIEAIPAVSTNIRINDESLINLKEISGVDKMLPIIGVAGKVSYQSSNTDIVVYSVLSDYLKASDIKPIKGKIFDYNELPISYGSIDNINEISNISILGSDDQINNILDSTDTSTNTEDVDQFQEEIKKISLPLKDKREAIVNETLLNVLGIETSKSIGEKFDISFIITGNLLDSGSKIESEIGEYEIIGVISENPMTPIIYVPLVDIKELGVDNYSQLEIVVEEQDDLQKVRKQVELLGFKTTSIMDTVVQIEQLFVTIRLFLWIIGLIALSVATLGMVNTLTISLLERTREVGLMKAIGMRSNEVQELFVLESISMGFFGGLNGLLLGYLGGKFVSTIFSIISIIKGQGIIDIMHVPMNFAVIIIVLSVTVGIITGIYPAVRSGRISPLDALRYE